MHASFPLIVHSLEIFGNWVRTYHCTVVFLTYLKVETGAGYTWVIATGYPVPKTGNATNHYS